MALREISSLVSLLEEVYVTIPRGREKDKRQITKKLIIKMRNPCAQYGTDFVVDFLEGTESMKKHYAKFYKTTMLEQSTVGILLPVK
jgi:hypothetical protein